MRHLWFLNRNASTFFCFQLGGWWPIICFQLGGWWPFVCFQIAGWWIKDDAWKVKCLNIISKKYFQIYPFCLCASQNKQCGWSQKATEFFFFFNMFAIHLSSRNEKCCQMCVDFFCLFQCSRNQQWTVLNNGKSISESIPVGIWHLSLSFYVLSPLFHFLMGYPPPTLKGVIYVCPLC